MPTIMKNGVPTQISVQEYNETLAQYRTEVLGIDETSGKLRHIEVKDLDKIWINGQEFTGMAYQGLLTVNTKTYVEEPTRANDGSIPNINDHDTFVVPRCKVNFKYFNIYDYQRLCEAVQSNEFYVEYWDKQFGEFVKHKMYCEPAEMDKLYNVGFDVFGVLDYEVSFIGTLNDLQEFTITYNDNGGTIKGDPQLYSATKIDNNGDEVANEYSKGNRVYLEDEVKVGDKTEKKKRYFEAIWYENTFTPQTKDKTILLTDTKYWLCRTLYSYSDTTTYNSIFSTTDTSITERQKEEGRAIAYEDVFNEKGEQKGRNYYIAIYNGSFSNKPLYDPVYWQKINVITYAPTKKYSSNRTSKEDTTHYGQFVIENQTANKVYEAIYYNDTFEAEYPTNTTYWQQLAIGEGIKVQWGKSVVIADAETLFDAPPNKYADKWTTNSNGSGFTYIEGQSINVYKNMTLYAKWE